MGRERGPGHRVGAADPRRLRRPHRRGADGHAVRPDRTRDRGRAGSGAAPGRAGPPGPVRAGGDRRTARAGHRALAPLDRARHARAALRPARRSTRATTWTCWTPRCAGPGLVDVQNPTFTVHNPLDLGPVARLPVLVAALGPVMLALAGERADGTVLWMADERAIAGARGAAHHQGRRRRGTPGAAGRGRGTGLPVPARRGRGRAGPRQPDPRRGGDLAQLPAAAVARRRP